jgi:DNA-binding MarR family transcriptional regulator
MTRSAARVPPEATVPWQVARAAEQHGSEFDPSALALTLTLYRTMWAFDRASAAELTPHGFTVSQFHILAVLHRAERPLTMGELGRAVSVRPANLTGVVDALTRRSLIERRVNPTDRRSYLIANTEAGEDFLARFLPGHWHYLDSLTSGLSREERTQLTELLGRLHASVEAVQGEPAPDLVE